MHLHGLQRVRPISQASTRMAMSTNNRHHGLCVCGVLRAVLEAAEFVIHKNVRSAGHTVGISPPFRHDPCSPDTFYATKDDP